ncbi:hypothetical protein OPAG_06915 [Rhodococcus opacus PD630]|uniref:mandelate racemase/muconate lactonizing enzyme family protein n=1 Tax=Rhodococcus opacus TaxID=37919 RepID=UPI00029CBC11|nr:mandelate racemase/muconate lactonizing enzyme family protein [Rhodococcus opacus]AHK36130.1 Mandelate racemase [Rhodococcus opacus PD630]EHI43627.1 hypothetical protein OPAG_06915 [Rhodococcus opacus PD630]UDH01248.1 mandelate racemase/muconate lactonizing enzyme family protein [Rhodococcus opacus PD630]
MKITRVEITPVLLPREVPPSALSAVGPNWDLPVALVTVYSDAGLFGVGHTLTLNKEYSGSLLAMIKDLSALVIDEDPHQPEKILGKILNPSNWMGPGGLLNIAVAALDIAIWDLRGKALEQPLWKLLGGASDRAPVYDSGSLLSFDIDELQEYAQRSLDTGYRAMKMRPAADRNGSVEAVRSRVAAVRDVIGFDIDLMYDVNQTWTPKRAVRMGNALSEYELAWIEDPTLMHDVSGQALVRRSLDTPICSGEYHYDAPPLLRLLESGAVDYLMVDLLRQGGITQFRKVAATAEAFGVKVASHLVPEFYSHCIAAVPNGFYVEGMPWTEILYQDLPELVDGQLVLSERPGHGLSVDPLALRKYSAGDTAIVY